MSGIAINEDNSHFFTSRGPEKMTLEGLCELVEHYTSPQVKEILYCPNSMRTSADSKVFDTVWKGFDPDKGQEQPFFASLPEAGRDEDTTLRVAAWISL